MSHPLPLWPLLLCLSLGWRGALAKAPTAPDWDAGAAVLQALVESRSLAGAVLLVADREKTLGVGTAGFSDVAAQKAMQPDAVMWIASMTKPFTATLLMMLVDEGKVHLDDPVEKYLPEFKGQMVLAEKDGEHQLLKKPAHPFTVREALSHTSGLAFKSPVEEPTLDMLPLATAVRGVRQPAFAGEPGTKYQYANEGINTMGRVIEVVSGMPYEQFLEQRLLAPLGLTDTTFWPQAPQLARLAECYKPMGDKSALVETMIAQLHYPLEERRRQPMPAGGLFSTARDVARFGQMLLRKGEWEGKRYLSEGAVAEMTKRQTPNEKDGYGLGLQLWGNGSFGHNGAYATSLQIDAAHGLVLVYMVQHAGWRDEEGKRGVDLFRQAAVRSFGKIY